MIAGQKIAGPVVPAIIAACIVIGDRISKVAVQHALSYTGSIPVIPGWLRIVHTENAGAAFGLLGEGNAYLRSAVLIGISGFVLAFVALALWGRRSDSYALFSRLGLTLIFGGALGNMYDRLLRGTVTDFIEMYHGAWSFPAFNVADSAITAGGILLAIELLWPRHGARLRNPTEAAPK